MTKPPVVILSYDWRLFLSMSVFPGADHKLQAFILLFVFRGYPVANISITGIPPRGAAIFYVFGFPHMTAGSAFKTFLPRLGLTYIILSHPSSLPDIYF
jgi:hypothetical protein